MQGYSLEDSVAMICGGASAIVAVVCVLSLVSLLAARSAEKGAERAAALLVGLLALALSLGVFWTALTPSTAIIRMLAATGLPPALFQVQASVAAVVVAILAWRFPSRQE